METLNYKVLESTGYNGYILKDAPVKVMQFGEGNFLRAFVDYSLILPTRRLATTARSSSSSPSQIPPDG